jgi:pyridoxine 5-phosphate synthase
MARLCVNIDHIATIRQARLEKVPDPIEAARLAEEAGAIGITAHLREDRRHIQDEDVRRLRRAVKGKFNLEMALTPEMIRIAAKIRPDEATLVPEKRSELTTEGGLEVAGHLKQVAEGVAALKKTGIVVSLFITPDPRQIKASAESGADFIELHTGAYAHKKPGALKRLQDGAILASKLGLGLNAGHGLSYANVRPVAELMKVQDLNIGHNIVAKAALVGMKKAVREMIQAMKGKA